MTDYIMVLGIEKEAQEQFKNITKIHGITIRHFEKLDEVLKRKNETK